MKKVLTLILAAVMALTFVTAASAQTINGGTSADVKATYTNSSTTPEKVSVDISWGAMSFTYTVSGEKTWDAEEHQYTDTTTAAWTATGNNITVTNHSNKAVTATFAYASENGYTAINGNFSDAANGGNAIANNQVSLNSAVDTAVNEAPAATVYLNLSGALSEATTTATKIGTVTVSIS